MRRAGPGVVAMLVAVAVVAVLAVAAGADRPTAAMPEVVRWWPLAVGLVVAAVATTVFVRTVVQLPLLDVDDEGDGRMARRFVTVLLVAVAVALLTVLAPTSEPPEQPGPVATPTAVESPARDAGSGATLSARPSAVALALLAGAVVVGVAVAVRRGRRSLGPDDHIPRDELEDLVGPAAARARAVADPREAVLQAFAAFEAALAARGHERRPSETQSAWVERLLVAHGAPPAPARRLRARFELARFASAPVTAADRDGALTDLDALLRARARP